MILRMRSMMPLCIAVLMVLLTFAAGCSQTHQARSVQYSGFLNDYSQLREGGRGEAQMAYINSNVGFGRYKAILLDPIKVYPGPKGSSMAEMDPETLRSLLNYFDASIREKLSPDYDFVNEPGPGVMRLRVALTESQGAKVALDTVSSIIPIGLATSALSRAAFGRGTAIGSAGAEFEALDSQTSVRLAAAVDRQIGNKLTGRLNKFSKWRATKASCDYWAEQLKDRLEDMREASQVGDK